MSGRLLAVAVIFILTAISAGAADPARSRGAALPVEETGGLNLRALFAQAPGVIESDGDGVTVSALTVEVLVARVGTDGKLIKACVGSEAEARKFLAAPIEKVKKGEHQQ